MKYLFFYDETEHSRKINYNTVSAVNYYDNFITAVIGWNQKDEKTISEKYEAFEKKYEYRKKDGELKSLSLKQRDFKFGFASLNKNTIGFYEDLLQMYDEKIIIYFSVFSKIEYVINQLLKNYNNSLLVDIDSMKYSIIKTILVYRPKKVIEAIYKEPVEFVNELRLFFEERIEKNKVNLPLKARENNIYGEILIILKEVDSIRSLEWSYFAAFEGFEKLLREMDIQDYTLVIDQEGEGRKTVKAAESVGIKNVSDGNSLDYIGIRMADMFVGLISRLMQSLKVSLTNDSANEKVEKTLLDAKWFVLNDRQLNLYKKLCKIICVDNKYWYNTYTGIYSDDLISFISLLHYMSHFKNAEEIQKNNWSMLPERFNAFACEALQRHFDIMNNKLSVEFVTNDVKDYFFNQCGAKVYKDVNLQPFLPIKEGKNQYRVLAVGLNAQGNALVTIKEKEGTVCYRIPDDYREWTMAMIRLANSGIKFFPCEVIFSYINGKYYVDVL